MHLAQLNVARPRAAMDDPQMADFEAALEPVNQLAEQAPGFVWRLLAEPYQVLWWVPAGHRPTVAEAERLKAVRSEGPGPAAFTFRHFYPLEILAR